MYHNIAVSFSSCSEDFDMHLLLILTGFFLFEDFIPFVQDCREIHKTVRNYLSTDF